MIADLKNGVIANYKSTGSGFPLICIMGLGATMDLWSDDFIAQLAQHYRVIIFDNRGVGQSRGPGPVTIKLFADDTVRLMQHLGIERAHVLGISMGGMIAQQVAVSYPERVAKLILGATSCAAKYIKKNPAILALLLFKAFPRFGLRAVVSQDYIAHNPKQVDHLIEVMKQHSAGRAVASEQLRACRGFDLSEQVGNIRAPTLLLAGTGDKIINWENSQILAAKIPGAQLVTFAGVGHVFPLERQEATITSIRRFLE